MTNIWELSIGIELDKQSLNKATNSIKTQFKKTGNVIEKDFTKKTNKGIGGIWSSLKKVGYLMAWIFSIWAIVWFSKKLLWLGSDLEEVSSKFNVVFNNSKEVKDNFDKLAKATNRSSLDMITFGSDIWDVLKPLGLLQEDVDKLSPAIVKLAVDVASFNNKSDAQVINAFRSALTGEREALKSLWIVINEADVKQEAFNLWLVKQGEQLTKQQKALATYNLLLANTSDAQGDAVRTSKSFANQLKWLQGAIKDTFAKVWKDVAGETAWILKQITVFISSYWAGIIKTIAETWKVLFVTIGEIMKAFWSLFSFITTWTNQNKDDVWSFALLFQKVVQWLGVWINLVKTIIKTLVNAIAIQLNMIVRYFVAMSESIDDVRNIVKTSFIGTFETFWDVAKLGVRIIWQVFVWMAEAIVNVFKGIATNVGVAVKKAGNMAISGLNKVIDTVNKIPWVNIGKLLWFDDADFKPFELKIKDNISWLKKEFKEFWKDVKWNYKGIWESFKEVWKNFEKSAKESKGFNELILKEVWKDWQDFVDVTDESNKRITKSIKEWWEAVWDNAKKWDTWYFEIANILDKYKWWVTKANKKTKEQGEVAEKAMDKVKDLYEEWEDKIEDVNKKQEKLKDDTIKYNDEIKDSIRWIWKELYDLENDYTKTINKIQWGTSVDLADRGVEVNDEIANIDNELKKLKKENLTTEVYEKQIELQKEKKKLLEEQALIVENTTEAQRNEATRVAWLNEAQLIKENADNEIAEQTRIFEAEKLRLENLQLINETFLNKKNLDIDELNKLMEDKRFQELAKEEQELIIKLAKEKIALTTQKNEAIAMQKDIANATRELSNSTTAIQLTNIWKIKSSYDSLIAKINSALSKQRQLNWFAWWWYTGQGWANEVAGLVHKWERVAPKRMVNSMKPLFDNLENSRAKGFESWGYTTNKTQTNNITVNDWIDLRGFLDYAKWKL